MHGSYFFYMVWSGQRGKLVKEEAAIKCMEKVMMIM
jgi:hypothetical protein